MIVTADRRSRPGSAVGGATRAGGSAVMLPSLLKPFLLERLRRRALELPGDPVDVLRVLQEVLEQLELALTGRRAEGRRLEVGEVEPRHLRRDERLRGGPGQRVAVHAERHLLVRR